MLYDDEMADRKARHDAMHHHAVRLGWNASQFDEATRQAESADAPHRRARARLPIGATPSELVTPPETDPSDTPDVGDAADPFPLPF